MAILPPMQLSVLQVTHMSAVLTALANIRHQMPIGVCGGSLSPTWRTASYRAVTVHDRQMPKCPQAHMSRGPVAAMRQSGV